MGGCSYDRDVYSASSTSNWGSSTMASTKLSRTTIDSALHPRGRTLKSNAKHPIIIVLDVTGSNIEFAKVLYDKLPMLYGQIEQKKYMDDFELSICAVGDAYTDSYPIQVGDFAKGIALDPIIEKLVLEGCGGGQEKESYELMAYYLLKCTEINSDAVPIVFFIGDEAPYSEVRGSQATELGIPYTEVDGDIFAALRKKFNDNVFMMLNRYNGGSFKEHITKSWTTRLAPEHVIKIKEEKSVVDLMLGVISMLSNTRTLDTYAVDMLDRGQTTSRIENVKQTLGALEKSLVPVTNVKGVALSSTTVKVGACSTRL